MKYTQSEITEEQSKINYEYVTIKLTKSRLEKGLLAVPKELSNLFPKINTPINILLGNSTESELKRFTSYSSSSNENRIGGLASWLKDLELQDGDEIVLQVIDKDRFIYRLIPEKQFIEKTQYLQRELDLSAKEKDVQQGVNRLSSWLNTTEAMTSIRELYRLSDVLPLQKRKKVGRHSAKIRDSVPVSIRTLFGNIYNGHCQVCDFFFQKIDGSPYYEIHHLDPVLGHHPKNLVVVCANCHRQFEYTKVKAVFSDNNWLKEVSFNDRHFHLNQVFLIEEEKKLLKRVFQ